MEEMKIQGTRKMKNPMAQVTLRVKKPRPNLKIPTMLTKKGNKKCWKSKERRSRTKCQSEEEEILRASQSRSRSHILTTKLKRWWSSKKSKMTRAKNPKRSRNRSKVRARKLQSLAIIAVIELKIQRRQIGKRWLMGLRANCCRLQSRPVLLNRSTLAQNHPKICHLKFSNLFHPRGIIAHPILSWTETTSAQK